MRELKSCGQPDWIVKSILLLVPAAAFPKTGVDTGQLTSILSQMLPQVIDKMTPNGEVPAANSILDMAKGLGAGQA